MSQTESRWRGWGNSNSLVRTVKQASSNVRRIGCREYVSKSSPARSWPQNNREFESTGCEISVDGLYRGRPDTRGRLTVSDLEPGSHNLIATQRPRYRDETVEVVYHLVRIR
jgi:hypothetical protein